MEPDAQHAETLWLGLDGMLAPLAEIEALLVYRPAWDRRIVAVWGSVPEGIRAVVLLRDGRALPSRRSLGDLGARWAAWRASNDDIQVPTAVPGRPKQDDEPAP